jgi:hypothetical protein
MYDFQCKLVRLGNFVTSMHHACFRRIPPTNIQTQIRCNILQLTLHIVQIRFASLFYSSSKETCKNVKSSMRRRIVSRFHIDDIQTLDTKYISTLNKRFMQS